MTILHDHRNSQGDRQEWVDTKVPTRRQRQPIERGDARCSADVARCMATLPGRRSAPRTHIRPPVRERQRLVDLFSEERWEYPSFAWQEAIVNAVAHRDYPYEGLSIEIWMFDDRLEIRSPGELVEPVTLDRLLKRERIHASRNPRIVRVLTNLGYMREQGEGIPRMFEAMEQEGLYPPVIRIEGDAVFTVILRAEGKGLREKRGHSQGIGSLSIQR